MLNRIHLNANKSHKMVYSDKRLIVPDIDLLFILTC